MFLHGELMINLLLDSNHIKASCLFIPIDGIFAQKLDMA